jgi:hypothetical protein
MTIAFLLKKRDKKYLKRTKTKKTMTTVQTNKAQKIV